MSERCRRCGEPVLVGSGLCGICYAKERRFEEEQRRQTEAAEETARQARRAADLQEMAAAEPQARENRKLNRKRDKELRKKGLCSGCEGSGKCFLCYGRGQVLGSATSAAGKVKGFFASLLFYGTGGAVDETLAGCEDRPCSACEATGKCEFCNGTGKANQRRASPTSNTTEQQAECDLEQKTSRIGDQETEFEESAELESEQITQSCPKCGQLHAVLEKFIGRKVRCARCKKVFVASEPDPDRDGSSQIADREDGTTSPAGMGIDFANLSEDEVGAVQGLLGTMAVCREHRQWQKGIDAADAMLEMCPQAFIAFTFKASALIALGNESGDKRYFRKAVDIYTQAIEAGWALNFDSTMKQVLAVAYCNRASIKIVDLGDLAGALEDYELALKVLPGWCIAQDAIGRVRSGEFAPQNADLSVGTYSKRDAEAVAVPVPAGSASQAVAPPAVQAAPAVSIQERFFIARGKEKLGPFTIDQMKALVVVRSVQASDWVLKEGAKQWIPASSVHELAFPTPPAAIPVVPPPLPTARWYYAKEGKTLGPISTEEVRQLLRKGQLLPNDFLCKEGAQTWVTVSSVKELHS